MKEGRGREAGAHLSQAPGGAVLVEQERLLTGSGSALFVPLLPTPPPPETSLGCSVWRRQGSEAAREKERQSAEDSVKGWGHACRFLSVDVLEPE